MDKLGSIGAPASSSSGGVPIESSTIKPGQGDPIPVKEGNVKRMALSGRDAFASVDRFTDKSRAVGQEQSETIEHLKNQLATANNEMRVLRGDIKDMEETLNFAQEQYSARKEEVKELTKIKEQNELQIKNLSEQIAKLTAELGTTKEGAEKTEGDLQGQISSLKAQVETLTSTNSELDAKIKMKDETIEKLNTEISDLKEQISDKEQKLTEWKDAFSTSQTKIEEATQMLEELSVAAKTAKKLKADIGDQPRVKRTWKFE